MAATTDRPGDMDSPDWDPERLLDTPVGHELQELARRILGPGPAAVQAVLDALARPLNSRVMAISRTATECRNRDGASVGLPSLGAGSLSEAVVAELERANAALPNRQREALVLRELSRLSYAQIARIMDLDVSAVGLLLARARLALREELRGRFSREQTPCAERERALRTLARRLDAEPVDELDEAWIFAHMATCPGCERAHAMMLEASFRYRAWVRP